MRGDDNLQEGMYSYISPGKTDTTGSSTAADTEDGG